LEFALIIEGTTEKVLQFIIPLKSVYIIYNRGFKAQKWFFEHYRQVQTIKNILIGIIFVVAIFFLLTVLELPSIGLCQY